MTANSTLTTRSRERARFEGEAASHAQNRPELVGYHRVNQVAIGVEHVNEPGDAMIELHFPIPIPRPRVRHSRWREQPIDIWCLDLA